MSRCHRPATASAVRPSAGGGPEKPKPGSDGATTVNASPGAPPCAPGSVSSGTSSRYSQNEPGQPWVSSSGSGAGPRPRWCTRWIACPPTTARACANRSSRAANAPASNRRQSASRPASQRRGTPRSQPAPPSGASRAADSLLPRSSSTAVSNPGRTGSTVTGDQATPTPFPGPAHPPRCDATHNEPIMRGHDQRRPTPDCRALQRAGAPEPGATPITESDSESGGLDYLGEDVARCRRREDRPEQYPQGGGLPAPLGPRNSVIR